MTDGFKQIPNTELMYQCNPSDVTIICENEERVRILWADMMFVTQFSDYAPWVATVLGDKSTPEKVIAVVEFMRAVNERNIPEAVEYGVIK
mgnify:CR=1 FL=1